MVWFEKTLDHVIEWKTKQRISSCPCDDVRFRCWANEGGTMMWDKWRGWGWESDWETRSGAQWKFWSLIGHLIYWSHLWDWASDYRRDYLVHVCLSSSFFLSFFVFCLSPVLPVDLFHCHSLFCLLLSLPVLHFAPLSSSQATAFTLLHIHRHTQYLTKRLDKEFQAVASYQTASFLKFNHVHKYFRVYPTPKWMYTSSTDMAENVKHASRWHIFAGIPFIAVCRDRLDRNLQANCVLVFPQSSARICSRQPYLSVSFSIQMVQSKQPFTLVRTRSLSQQGAALLVSAEWSFANQYLNYWSAGHTQAPSAVSPQKIYGQLGHVPVSFSAPKDTDSSDTTGPSKPNISLDLFQVVLTDLLIPNCHFTLIHSATAWAQRNHKFACTGVSHTIVHTAVI